jgi:hypothetical protein
MASLAVKQFCAVAFGTEQVHKPVQSLRVEKVTAEERYCGRCCSVRVCDVVYPSLSPSPSLHDGEGCSVEVVICRVCGEEV